MWQGNNNGRGGFGSSGGGRGGTFTGGRGRGRSSGGRYSSRGGGRGGGTAAGATETAQYEICSFFAKSNSCRHGDSCRFSHNLAAVAYTIPAHQKPIHSMGVMQFPTGPKLLSGSADGTVKLWNLATQEMETSVNAPNDVRHIEVEGDTVMWSVDEPAKDAPKITVGTVYKLVTPQQLIPMKRSEDMPYSHASGEIRSFRIAMMDNVMYVVTAAADGLIRTWKFDSVANIFEPVGVLEGHLRAITSILLHDAYLWSGSMDCSVRVWEVASGKCVGVLSAAGGGAGHADAVTCLVKIPPSPTSQDTFIASGGADGSVNIWTTLGAHYHQCWHGGCVTTMTVFQDEYNGVPALIIGLADGNIVLRSCATMNILFNIYSSICQTKTVWSIQSVGRSCFAVAGDDGNIVLWQIRSALADKA